MKTILSIVTTEHGKPFAETVLIKHFSRPETAKFLQAHAAATKTAVDKHMEGHHGDGYVTIITGQTISDAATETQSFGGYSTDYAGLDRLQHFLMVESFKLNEKYASDHSIVLKR